MSVAISFENVSKKYRLGQVGTGTLSHDLHRLWAKLWGKPDPFALVGHENDRESLDEREIEHDYETSLPGVSSKKRRSEYVWALKDISFDVTKGEILGIIGRNGAGKSTLLKLLSRITAPTDGTIKARGRIASLLEVGTGFHPELTGRENVFLNGTIMGMRRHEISSQLDEIISFSGCGAYIDTPVKRYSSGMMVRLGFAVAAHLRGEILVVDEVLAVGDAEFQKKCIAKMHDIAGSGRTILFVSHNMSAVRSLCQRVIRLDKGRIDEVGASQTVVMNYLAQEAERVKIDLVAREDRSGSGSARFSRVEIASLENEEVITSSCRIKITLTLSGETSIKNPKIMIGLYDEHGAGMCGFDSDVTGGIPQTISGKATIQCCTEPINMTAGRCYVNIAVFDNGNLADHVVNAGYFTVEDTDFFGNGRSIQRSWMPRLLKHHWEVQDN